MIYLSEQLRCHALCLEAWNTPKGIVWGMPSMIFHFFGSPHVRFLFPWFLLLSLSLSLSIYWYSRVHRSKSSCGHGCCSRHAEFIRSCCGWDFSRLWVARREVGPSLGMLLTSCYVSGCHAFWAGTFGWQRRANMG